MSKSQKRIDEFFNSNSKNNNYKIKRYFYLRIDDKFKPTKEAYWTDIKPEKINFIEIINCDYIKKGYYFYICGYFSDYTEKPFIFTKEKVYNNIEYLQSHLQKNIRKGNETLAIQSCYHLFKLDLIGLLKNLTIIMLEDVILHESFSTLVWYIVANSTNNFKMKIYDYEWILGLIYVLCKIETKDNLEMEDDSEYHLTVIDKLNSYNNSSFLEEEYSLLYSINIRISYGANKVQLKILNNALNSWYKRFKDKNSVIILNKNEILPICIYVKELTLNDWDVSAIDHDCHPKLLEYIYKKYNNLSIDNLKNIIMHHSSLINYRCKPNIYDINNWNNIKKFVEKTQRYLLDSYH
jgi:hypothetical protein